MRFCSILLFCSFFLGSYNLLISQENPNSFPYQLRYDAKSLSEILYDLEKKHDQKFSYVKEKLDLNKKINVFVRNKSLHQAMIDLFSKNNIAYNQMGNHWILKMNSPLEQKQTSVSRKEEIIKAQASVSDTLKPEESSNNLKEIELIHVPGIDIRTIRLASDFDAEEKLSWQDRMKKGDLDLVHFSLFGNQGNSTNRDGIFSLSFGWGTWRNSELLQIGGVGNSLKRDMIGMQLAPFFNGVGKNTSGFQLSGLMNITAENLQGVQISGFLNHAGIVNGLQLSLGINHAEKKVNGLQLAGFGNMVKKFSAGSQIAGVFNYNKGGSHLQLSVLSNKTDSLKGVQISMHNQSDQVKGIQLGLVNHTRILKGLQLGIINFADSVKGMPIGLINIIKKGGYNRIEAAFSESIHVGFALKMGAKHLYSIYQGGFSLKGNAWGIGGGFGTLISMNKKWGFNVELTCMHINENKSWTQALNLLSQLKAGFEYKLDKGFGIFVGPTFNFSVSNYFNENYNTIGSSMPMYSFFDKTSDGLNMKWWFGIQTGIRMKLW